MGDRQWEMPNKSFDFNFPNAYCLWPIAYSQLFILEYKA